MRAALEFKYVETLTLTYGPLLNFWVLRTRACEEAGIIPITLFEKGNPTEKSETQNHRANGLLPRRSMPAGLPKVRKPSKLSKGGPINTLFYPVEHEWTPSSIFQTAVVQTTAVFFVMDKASRHPALPLALC